LFFFICVFFLYLFGFFSNDKMTHSCNSTITTERYSSIWWGGASYVL